MNAPGFTSAAVHKELSTLDTAKSSGPGGFHPLTFQVLADFLAEPITALANKSLQSGEVPQDWRQAIICPIFKKVDPEDAVNYRPVSITSVLCKILQKLLNKALLLFLTETRFLPRHAYPTLIFRKNALPVCWMKDIRWT